MVPSACRTSDSLKKNRSLTGYAALAIVIAGSMLNNPAMAQPAVLYGGMMFFGVGVLLSFLRATETIRRRLSQPERA